MKRRRPARHLGGPRTVKPRSWTLSVSALLAAGVVSVFPNPAAAAPKDKARPTGNNSLSAAVSLTVNVSASSDTTPPTVSITSPASGATDTTAPYTFSLAFSSANNGTHSWTARAYDGAGNREVS